MKNNVNIAVLTSEYFDKWDSFRYLLLIKTVPMIQTLPRKERQRIVQNLVIKEFKDGEYIIRQGDTGEDFYIIQGIIITLLCDNKFLNTSVFVIGGKHTCLYKLFT